MAYARITEHRPRSCIFVGTVNDKRYLHDRTGNRRFAPVPTAAIDLDALANERQQLWAEAAYREAMGEPIELPPELWPIAAIEQEARLSVDPWEDILRRLTPLNPNVIVHEAQWKITSEALIGDVLKIPTERQGRPEANRAGLAMRRLGWTGPKQMRFPGLNRPSGFCKPIPDKVDKQDKVDKD
jgi:predicted P-loop ATPase